MFPVVRWLPAYRRDWWRADPVGGLTAAAVVIPKAMALWGSDMRDRKAPPRTLRFSASPTGRQVNSKTA